MDIRNSGLHQKSRCNQSNAASLIVQRMHSKLQGLQLPHHSIICMS